MRSLKLNPSAPRAAAAAVLLAFCAGCASTAATEPTTTSTTPATTTTVHYVPTYVTVDHHKVLLPVEAHNVPISPYNAEGQNIIITNTGFEPHRLFAVHAYPIVFTNLTDNTQVIKFYNFPNLPKPEVIPPGGNFSFRYGSQIALGYGNAAGSWRGLVYIDELAGIAG
jgi:hypothetical protein